MRKMHLIDAYLLREHLSETTLNAIKSDLILGEKYIRTYQEHSSENIASTVFVNQEFRSIMNGLYGLYVALILPYGSKDDLERNKFTFEQFYNDPSISLSDLEKHI